MSSSIAPNDDTKQPKLLSLSALGKPYFDFLILEKGDCWERPGRLKQKCFHNPESLLIPDSTIIIFVNAFLQSHPNFNGYGPTEYAEDTLADLQQKLFIEIQELQICQTISQFQGIVTSDNAHDYDRLIENWPSKWQIIRNELCEQGQQILELADQALHEQKSLLVMGI